MLILLEYAPERSTTDFSNGYLPVVDSIELMMRNLYRGESVRIKEIEMDFTWKESPKNLSKIFR